MNILMIGGPNSLCCQLIKKFNKEGHRVSLLTGSYFGDKKYPHVFERYDFPYTSEVLPDIFTSVVPDLTVFAGAYDSNFDWEGDGRAPVEYVFSVMNVLTAFSSRGSGRFVYISSDSVFAGRDDVPFSEDDEPNATDPRGAALIQAEDICKKSMSDLSLDIIIVRLGGYYHLPKEAGDVDDVISRICVNYLMNGDKEIDRDALLTPISESDAVYFISRIALAKSHGFSCYHVSSGRTVTAGEVLEQIRAYAAEAGYEIPKNGGSGTDDSPKKTRFSKASRRAFWKLGSFSGAIKQKKTAEKRNFDIRYPGGVLDVARFSGEFGINRLASFEKELKGIVAHIVKNKTEFLMADVEKPGFFTTLMQRFGWVLQMILPFVENLICFIPFFMLNNRATGSKYFARIDFYLLYVLLFAIVYGQHQATFSALLATAGFLFRQMYHRSGADVLLDYNTYVWIAQLFILGLVVGYLKDRLTDLKNEALQDHEHMTKQIDDIREINGSNVRVKDALQTQLINQNDSIGKIFEITSTLDQYSAEEVVFQATDILRRIMGSDDIAIYLLSQGPYARLFTATTELAASLGNSVKYEDLGELFERLKNGKPYINRSLVTGMPMMAVGIYEGDEIKMIAMIWKLPWEKMTLGQCNVLSVTASLIQNALLRTNRYLEILHNERFIDDTKVMQKETFISLIKAYKNAKERNLSQFSLIHVINEEHRSFHDVGVSIAELLRETDYLGVGNNDELYVLLANTPLKGAEAALSRFISRGLTAEIADVYTDGVI